jgi:hypothetical protein
MQAFVDASFENITSTDHALSLLAQFSAILQRDALKQELESKYQVGTWGTGHGCALGCHPRHTLFVEILGHPHSSSHG